MPRIYTRTYKLKKGLTLTAYGDTKRTDSGILNNMFELQNQDGEELAYVANLNVITTKYKSYFTKTQLNELAELY